MTTPDIVRARILSVLSVGLTLTSAVTSTAPVVAQELTGELSVEARWFPQTTERVDLSGHNVSVAFEPEWYVESEDGKHLFTVVPFLRLDQHDDERTHWDIREFTWEYIARDWELRAGVRKVFWGVTESNHLVDVINQTDLVEDLDGEEKLGQPMVNLAWVQPWGTLDLFALIGFRERPYVGVDGRPGLPFPLDTDAVVEGGDLSWAARWFHTAGRFDVGVAHFYGTSRDPRFRVAETRGGTAGSLRFVPLYDRVHQTGLDLQLTVGGWLWKLETINRSGQGPRFAAVTGGFEYTFPNIAARGLDIGVLAEYSYDERGVDALTPFEDDLFVGSRLAFNDVQSTEVLAGAAVDLDSGARFLNVEASRRFGDRWTLDLRIRAFVGVPADDLFLFGIRDDDYLQASWNLYF